MSKEKEQPREIDKLFKEYTEYHQNKTNINLRYLFVPLFIFSCMGLITATPFPHLAFLGKYNMFINWFSVALAIAIYYYLKLSPLLSYLMLFTFGALYFFIVQLEYVEQGGGPRLWQVSAVLFVISLIGLLWGGSLEKKKSSLWQKMHFIVIAPVWMWFQLVKRFNWRY
ncbi:DUF962 domain-containing protein [Pseudopedobacter beijingensis]|uniref:DUF962 domain-containing protein n=1 Tax=Pseudopedobacter beijingensis TaxID=1207056 RepID=A0ABW4IEV5_9SPHI